jgi:hypothetical protein
VTRHLGDGELCDICGRVVLPGEPLHVFEDPERGGRRRPVCPLCHRKALQRGWIRAGGRVRSRGETAA